MERTTEFRLLSPTEQQPEGFVLRPDFLTAAEETELLQFLPRLDYGPVRMHGVTAKRRVAQFGLHYAFESFKLTATTAIPAELETARTRAAEAAGVHPEEFAEALVIEYPPGAGIGWHRDAPMFGIVAGVSLGAPCRMRFQKGSGAERTTSAVVLPPRSLYLLTGPARWEWQHMLPALRDIRYSLTFRTLRKGQTASPTA